MPKTIQNPNAIDDQITPKKAPKAKNGSFSKFQASIMILLTLIVSVGGWYAVGKYFVWTDLDMKRVNEQLAYLQQKVQADPSNAQNRIELGYTYSLKGQNEQAMKEFNQVLILEPKNFDALYNIGLLQLKEERYNEALLNFQKAAELSPRDYKVHLQLGITYRNLAMYDEAQKSLNKANTLNPTSVEIIYQTGRIAEDQGDTQAAIEIYKEALTFDPLYKDAVESLERLEKK